MGPCSWVGAGCTDEGVAGEGEEELSDEDEGGHAYVEDDPRIELVTLLVRGRVRVWVRVRVRVRVRSGLGLGFGFGFGFGSGLGW